MIALALTALLSFQDPPLDAVGNGSLQAPTAPVYRSASAYDILALDVLDTPFFAVALTFESLENPFGLPNGFSLPIIELYVEDTSLAETVEGASTLLPGSGMRLPAGERWHYALRLSGDEATLYRASGPDSWEASATPPNLSVEGATLTVATGLEAITDFKLYGMVGSYNPFSPEGWQPLASTPSPWAFSSDSQAFPVVDVLAATEETQVSALTSGVLPAIEVRSPAPLAGLTPWSLLMAGGMVIVLIGLVGRLLVSPQATEAPPPAPASGERALPTEAIYVGAGLDSRQPSSEVASDEELTRALLLEPAPDPEAAAALLAQAQERGLALSPEAGPPDEAGAAQDSVRLGPGAFFVPADWLEEEEDNALGSDSAWEKTEASSPAEEDSVGEADSEPAREANSKQP